MSWLYLALAIVFEAAGTTSMKLSDGLSRLWPTLSIFVFYGISFIWLTLALRAIEVGTAYAIWSGAGTALIATIGILHFGESITPAKLGALALIILGVLILKASE